MDKRYKCYIEAEIGEYKLYRCERSHYITDKFIMDVFNIRKKILAFWIPYDILMGISGEIPLCCVFSWIKYHYKRGYYHGKTSDRSMALEHGGFDSSRNISLVPCKYHAEQRDNYK